MSTIVFFLIALQAASTLAAVKDAVIPLRKIQVTDQYVLELHPPLGWLENQSTQGVEFVTSLPSFASYINLDWYQPPRDRTYHDFDKRVADEVKHIMRMHAQNVRVRRFSVDKFEAAEMSYTARGRRFAFTYLGLPLDETDTWGEIFVIFFEGPATEEGRRALRAYRNMVETMHVR